MRGAPEAAGSAPRSMRFIPVPQWGDSLLDLGRSGVGSWKACLLWPRYSPGKPFVFSLAFRIKGIRKGSSPVPKEDLLPSLPLCVPLATPHPGPRPAVGFFPVLSVCKLAAAV